MRIECPPDRDVRNFSVFSHLSEARVVLSFNPLEIRPIESNDIKGESPEWFKGNSQPNIEGTGQFQEGTDVPRRIVHVLDA